MLLTHFLKTYFKIMVLTFDYLHLKITTAYK